MKTRNFSLILMFLAGLLPAAAQAQSDEAGILDDQGAQGGDGQEFARAWSSTAVVKPDRKLQINVVGAENADRNDDRAIDLSEFLSARRQEFARFDVNGDLVLDLDEMKVRNKAVAEAREDTKSPGQKRYEARHKKPEARRKTGADRLDANGDGIVTLQEFDEENTRIFKKMDRNGDGVLDGRDFRR